MGERQVTIGAAAFCTVLGLFLVQCNQAPSDDNDASASGQAGASKIGTGGAGASGGAASSAGNGAAGSAGSSVSAGVGASGSASTAGTGAVSGASAAGGAGNGAGRSGAGGSSTGGKTGAISCDTTQIAVKPPAPASIDEATFNAQWPALACAAMKPCCGTAAPPYDEAKCLAYAPTALDKADKKYDANEAGLCFDGLKASAARCPGPTSYRGLPGACLRVYRGTLPLGMYCIHDSDCAPDPRGLVDCDLQTSECTVQIRGKVGDACNQSCEILTDSGTCYPINDPSDPSVVVTCHDDDGLRCSFGGPFPSGSTPAPAAGTCQPALGLGCECILGGSSYCNGQTHCTDDLYSTCVARGDVGAPCTFDSDCSMGNYCPETDVCTPMKHGGEPCTDHDECYGGYCWTSVCFLDNGDGRGSLDDKFCDGVGTE